MSVSCTDRSRCLFPLKNDWGVVMKKLFLIIFIALLVPCFSACGKESAESDDPGLLLGFSQIGSESAWRIGNTLDIEEAADKSRKAQDSAHS